MAGKVVPSGVYNYVVKYTYLPEKERHQHRLRAPDAINFHPIFVERKVM